MDNVAVRKAFNIDIADDMEQFYDCDSVPRSERRASKEEIMKLKKGDFDQYDLTEYMSYFLRKFDDAETIKRLIKLMMKRGVDFNQKLDIGNLAHFFTSSFYDNSYEILKFLAEHGLDIRGVGYELSAPLDIAIEKSKTKISNYLFENINADIEYVEKYIFNLKFEIAEKLLNLSECITEEEKYKLSKVIFFIRQLKDISLENLLILIRCENDYEEYLEKIAFIFAPRFDRWDVFDYMLNRKFDVNSELIGCTPLFSTVINGDEDRALKLIELGAKIDFQSKYSMNNTCLHLIVRKQLKKTFWVIYNKKMNEEIDFDVDCSDSFNSTAISIAFFNEDYETVKNLLEMGANPNSYTGRYGTAINRAIYENRKDLVELLIAKGCDLNFKVPALLTPLEYAMNYNRIEIALTLLENGASCIIPEDEVLKEYKLDLPEYIQNPILVNAIRLYPKMTDVQKTIFPNLLTEILKYKETVNIADYDGVTPLMMAVFKSNSMVINILLKSENLDIDAQDKYGFTALSYACKYGRATITKKLIDAGANINHRTKDNKTPLILACIYERYYIVELLLCYNAEMVCAQKHKGRGEYSEILIAATTGDYRSLTCLLEKGALINDIDDKGNTPLIVATKRANTAVIFTLFKYAKKNNIDIDYIDESFLICIENGSIKALKLFLKVLG